LSLPVVACSWSVVMVPILELVAASSLLSAPAVLLKLQRNAVDAIAEACLGACATRVIEGAVDGPKGGKSRPGTSYHDRATRRRQKHRHRAPYVHHHAPLCRSPLKTWPRWPPHLAHVTSVRTMPCERSTCSTTASWWSTRVSEGGWPGSRGTVGVATRTKRPPHEQRSGSKKSAPPCPSPFTFDTGCAYAGQPHPESNLSSPRKSTAPQPAQR
jgi:hypothetical protein